MATYNGERYLAEQVNSILSQMGETEELVVVDDASNDGTVGYLMSIGDPRIRIYRNASNIGHVQSFARVIGLARGKYILMADQDDVWIDGRLHTMRDSLSAGSALVSTNTEFIDSQGRMIPPLHPELAETDSCRYFTNIVKIFTGQAYYNGCAMGLREELRRLILPIPGYVESHDLWIAMAANAVRSNYHLACCTLRRRVHGSNASVVSRPLLSKLISRSIFLLSLAHISIRLIRRAAKLHKAHS
jgi:glycosyltransferase involved in cell wall biosynthesis